MDAKGVVAAALYLISYFPPSYVVLVYHKVESQRVWRALQLGLVLAAIQVVIPLTVATLINQLVGGVLYYAALPLSYLYVRRVLAVKWWQNVTIIIAIPFAAGLIAGALLLLGFSRA